MEVREADLSPRVRETAERTRAEALRVRTLVRDLLPEDLARALVEAVDDEAVDALDGDGLRVGVVLNSATGEEFAAVRGCGATLNGAPIRVSAVAERPVCRTG